MQRPRRRAQERKPCMGRLERARVHQHLAAAIATNFEPKLLLREVYLIKQGYLISATLLKFKHFLNIAFNWWSFFRSSNLFLSWRTVSFTAMSLGQASITMVAKAKPRFASCCLLRGSLRTKSSKWHFRLNKMAAVRKWTYSVRFFCWIFSVEKPSVYLREHFVPIMCFCAIFILCFSKFLTFFKKTDLKKIYIYIETITNELGKI